jgi:capping protein beta
MFNEYRRLYYDQGIASVYFWETGATSFACAFLIKRDCEAGGGVKKATWESSNLVQAETTLAARSVKYSITSTVFLQIEASDQNAGNIDMSGGLTRQHEDFKPCSDPFGEAHVFNMISLVENMESKLRGSLDMIYVGKTREIMERTRHVEVARAKVRLA